MKIFSALVCAVTVFFHAWPCAILALESAVVEVVIYEPSSGGDYNTYTYELEGKFSNAGAATSAEGDILQVHPLGLFNTSDEGDLYDYGWVGVVKLTPPDELNKPCFTLLEKVKRAMQRGATAIIFDVTDYPEAASELNAATTKIARPVVLIEGQDAKKLTHIIKKYDSMQWKGEPRARIRNSVAGYTPQRASNEYFDMVIFMTFFILVSIVCFILLLKIKWRQKQKESSLTRMALHALSRMETRKYQSVACNSSNSKVENENNSDAESTTSRQSDDTASKCVICLEKFQDGQDVRIVPCRHEFHKECVDPWLLSNFTCPLCMLNIVEREGTTNKPRRARHWFTRRCGRCLSNPDSIRSSLSSIAQYMPEDPSHRSTQDISNEPFYINEENSRSRELAQSSTGLDNRSSRRSLDRNFISLQELRTNCESRGSSNSLRGIRRGGSGYMSPYEKRNCQKSYTHQVVVVAPITAGMLDVSQEDIV